MWTVSSGTPDIDSDVDTAVLAVADDLLRTMAAIRRGARLAGRPPEFVDLTGAQLDLLRLVRRRAGIAVAEAAAELALAANTVSTLVSQLCDAGLLTRSVDESDRRIARLELTASTARRLGRFRDRRVALVAAAIDALEPAERCRLEAAAPVLARLGELMPELLEPHV